MATTVNSHTDARIDINGWKDDDGNVINLTLLDALRVSVRDTDSGTFLRKSENYLASPWVTLGTTGNLRWYLTPWDTQLIGDTEPGDVQPRSAYVRLAWGAERSDDLTDPFTTAEDSRRVVVAHTAHGLAKGDSVFFEADTDVGGLDLGTQFTVDDVISSNSYAVYANEPATSDATTDGGSVVAWIRGKAASADKTFAVKRNDPL